MAPDRATFLARLFSRARPAGLSGSATVAELFDAFTDSPVDVEASARHLQDTLDLLAERQWLRLSADDHRFIEQIHAVFREFGPDTNYNSRPGRGGMPGRFVPSYAELMTAVAPDGRPYSYLASEESYRVVRDLQQRNLIVPLTGDFGGETTLREVAAYVERHQAAVHVFYASNVEQYLFQGADSRGNGNGGAAAGRGFVGAAGRSSDIASIEETLRAFAEGRIATYNDLFTIAASRQR